MTTLTKQQIEYRARLKAASQSMAQDEELSSILGRDDSIESYWANSASQSVINDYRSGNVKTVTL